MVTTIGDRAVLAVEVLDRRPVDGPDMRPVDVWIDGRSVCVDDNVVFLPSFVPQIRRDLRDLRNGRDLTPPPGTLTPLEAHRWCRRHGRSGAHERYWFMQWGETMDSVSTFLFQFDDRVVITAQFWRHDAAARDRHRVLIATLPRPVLDGLLAEAIDTLER